MKDTESVSKSELQLDIALGICLFFFIILWFFGENIHFFNNILNKEENYYVDIGNVIFNTLLDFLCYHIFIVGSTFSVLYMAKYGINYLANIFKRK